MEQTEQVKLRKHRAYAFTLNNWTEEEYNRILSIKHKYLIVGKENGDSGNPHLQGYIYFENPRYWKAVKKKLGVRVHLEVAYSSAQDNYNYCVKEGDYYESGEMPQVQGARNDIEAVREVLNRTGRIRDVVDVVTGYQTIRFAETLVKYVEKKRSWKPKVYWFYGPTGTGKTKKAMEMFPDAYFSLSTGKWWEGYDADGDVIIDDMRKDFCKFHELLRLLDRYPMRIEVKGGSRQFLAKNIVITSCYHPEEMFETREDINQLLRRIDVIEEFTDIV